MTMAKMKNNFLLLHPLILFWELKTKKIDKETNTFVQKACWFDQWSNIVNVYRLLLSPMVLPVNAGFGPKVMVPVQITEYRLEHLRINFVNIHHLTEIYFFQWKELLRSALLPAFKYTSVPLTTVVVLYITLRNTFTL